MLDSINIGVSGLIGYSKGLRVIANNTSNLNTPGFKSASLQFADMFAAHSPGSGGGMAQVGYGVNTAGTTLNFKQGELRQTGNKLDLGIDGQGLFTLRDDAGRLHYTRAGQFEFNDEGVLVNRLDDAEVLGRNSDGSTGPITISGSRVSDGRTTATVRFTGALLSTATTYTASDVRVVEANGTVHTMSVRFEPAQAGPGEDPATIPPNSWDVALLDSTGTVVGSSRLVFVNGRPTAETARLAITYTPAGAAAIPLTLDFSSDVQTVTTGQSTLAFASQDGYPTGALTDVSFDAQGTLVLNYSNGQKVNGARLLLGRFDSLDAVRPTGNNQFDASEDLAWETGVANEGAFGAVRSGVVEISNVDLSQEFSDLVIMQRGYQAASQVVTAANEMLQQLFSLKSK